MIIVLTISIALNAALYVCWRKAELSLKIAQVREVLNAAAQ